MSESDKSPGPGPGPGPDLIFPGGTPAPVPETAQQKTERVAAAAALVKGLGVVPRSLLELPVPGIETGVDVRFITPNSRVLENPEQEYHTPNADFPALVQTRADGDIQSMIWYENGVYHRDDGEPAIIRVVGYAMIYNAHYWRGVLHNPSGPAIWYSGPDEGDEEFAYYGLEADRPHDIRVEDGFTRWTYEEPWAVRHVDIFPNGLVRDTFAELDGVRDQFISVRICWFAVCFEHGMCQGLRPHRIGAPQTVGFFRDTTIDEWRSEGSLHRLDGPAVVNFSGDGARGETLAFFEEGERYIPTEDEFDLMEHLVPFSATHVGGRYWLTPESGESCLFPGRYLELVEVFGLNTARRVLADLSRDAGDGFADLYDTAYRSL